MGQMVDMVSKQLEDAGVPEAKLGAQYLLGSVVSEDGGGDLVRVLPGDYSRHMDRVLNDQQKQRLRLLVQCRLSRMPLQYILGNWDFHNITLAVRPPVFIPRPETEQLVDLVLDCLAPNQPQHLLEVGPGSGAVSLALLAARPDLQVTAVERSVAAVQLCQENAERLGLEDRLTLVSGRVGEDEVMDLLSDCVFHALVSNPPYVLRKDLMDLAPEISLFEDLRALDGGAEGLDVILPILDLAGKCLVDGGRVLLEVDPCHAHILPPKLANMDTEFRLDQVVKDFLDKDRFLILEKL